MSPELFKQSKNLFLVFPPGCGGNHVANLLSMHPEFEPRYTHANYYQDIIDQYEKHFSYIPCNNDNVSNAHFCDLENLQPETLTKFQSKVLNSKKRYIFCSHAVEYIIRSIEGKIEPFTDSIICLFTKPYGSNKVVNNRMRNGAWYNGERDDFVFIDIPVAKLYEPNNFIRYNSDKIKEDKIFTLDTDRFYSLEGYDYFFDIIKTNLGIELPEVCRKIHTQYINYVQELYGKG